MKYRSRMDIAAAILDVAQGGALKTKIMYTAFSHPRSSRNTWTC
jgi:predicted transcriptional regulator